jgi:hypothetical protein
MADQSQVLSIQDFGRQFLKIQPGTTLSGKDADRVRQMYGTYMTTAVKELASASKPAFNPSGSEVSLPDGRKIQMVTTSSGSAMPAPKEEAPKFERITAADGTVKLIDTMTGKAITAWDEQTGSPVKAPVRSGDDAVKDQQTQILAQDIAKLQAAGKSWFQSDASYQRDIAAKQAQLNAIYNPQSMAGPAMAPAPAPMPSPTPAATPQATPAQAPTPDAAYLSTPAPSPSVEATPDPRLQPQAASMEPSMEPSSIKAAYKAGKLTREQAVGMLKPYGY